ncbi:MAG: hypothetical protein ATN35_06190 [Epulopiscium sp. Nele67-Bin004]|nr:MAG: hypothetical protein ATN35_06190 [Epulopiscium sp. Nele67-Bin004]
MKQTQTHTPKINPLMGLFGFLGLVGFIPLIIEVHKPNPFDFIFFGFFGFFGIYYMGKMSNTLIDERYIANQLRATTIANRIALSIILAGILILGRLVYYVELYTITSLLVTIIAFAFALSQFLQSFLLYKFETTE